jgi:ketosteroid isomerase-like protein
MDNTATVLRQHHELWSKGHVGLVDELYTQDFIGHHPGEPDWTGPESVKLSVTTIREAFPDFAETVEDVVAAGDRVVTRFTSSGTHLGELGGIAPTGRRMAMSEMAIFRLAGGRIVEQWGQLDRLGMFQQLGVVPTTWPPMELLYEITFDVDVQDLGTTPSGQRRIVVVKGGSFAGPRLRGRVLPGGGDWLLVRTDGSRRLDVRGTLQTDDGALIYGSYLGVIRGTPDDPSTYYFRTAPLFETAAPRYAWLNHVLAVGYGWRREGQIGYSVYAIR